MSGHDTYFDYFIGLGGITTHLHDGKRIRFLLRRVLGKRFHHTDRMRAVDLLFLRFQNADWLKHFATLPGSFEDRLEKPVAPWDGDLEVAWRKR